MTFGGDFNTEEDKGFEEEGRYPTAFGVTFTPKISGIALGGLGLIGAIYVGLNFLMPAYEEYQTQKQQETDLTQQLTSKQQGQIAQKIQELEQDLNRKENLRNEVMGLFAQTQDLETLLIDISRFFRAEGVELLSFVPQDPQPTVVTDSSLGPAANNKVKRQSISIEMQGGFAETQSVIQKLERLQPLIIVKNLSTVIQEGTSGQLVINSPNSAAIIPQEQKPIKTNFQIHVLVSLTPEEFAQLNPPPAPPPEPSAETK